MCPPAYLEEGDAGAVNTFGQLAVRPIEVDPVAARLQRLGVHTAVLQEHVQGHARPDGGTDGAGTPAEALALSGHVHLLAAVARADKGDGQGPLGQGHQLVHGQYLGLRHAEARHGDAVLVPGQLGHRTVVAVRCGVVWGEWGDCERRGLDSAAQSTSQSGL